MDHVEPCTSTHNYCAVLWFISLTHPDSCREEAQRALPDPKGSMPTGVLMAVSQSSLSIIPLTI